MAIRRRGCGSVAEAIEASPIGLIHRDAVIVRLPALGGGGIDPNQGVDGLLSKALVPAAFRYIGTLLLEDTCGGIPPEADVTRQTDTHLLDEGLSLKEEIARWEGTTYLFVFCGTCSEEARPPLGIRLVCHRTAPLRYHGRLLLVPGKN